MSTRNKQIVVQITPEQFWEDWRLVGVYDRRTNELADLRVLPPHMACPADGRYGYCLLLFNGTIRDTLRLRGITNIDRAIVWIFDRSGQEVELRRIGPPPQRTLLRA
jgi:hypothetical protein